MNKKEMHGIAMERIGILHELSQNEKSTSLDDSRIHIDLMERIARRTDVTLPQSIKRSYCKKCKTPYGRETKLRLKKGKILLLTCSECGDRRRFDYRMKQKS